MEFMSKERLEIAKIEGISSIHFYDLYDRNGLDKERKNCIGLIVFFDGGILNYCELDQEYEFYKAKVFNQYYAEKNTSKIFMDKQTKVILDSSEIEVGDTSLSKYINSKSYNTKLIDYKEKRILQVEDILIYYIKQIYTLLGYRTCIEDIKCGIGDNYSILISLIDKDNIKSELELPAKLILKDNFECEIKIGNILQNINYLTLKIVFKDNKIDINLVSEDNSFNYATTYSIKDNELSLEALMVREGETIFYDKNRNETEISSNELEMIRNYASIEDIDISKYSIAKLPWGGYYLYTKTRKPNGPRFDLTDSSSIYLSIRDNFVDIKHYREKGIIGDKDLVHSRIDGIIKNMHIYLCGSKKTKYAICETSFKEANYAIGLYKRELANRHYYDAFRTTSQTLKSINRPILHPVSLDLEPNQGYRLFEEETLMDIVKRGKR